MEELQFKNLCKTCDELLLEDGVSLERVALPSLHVIRDHPVFLSAYNSIVDQEEELSKDVRLFSLGFFLKSIWNLRKTIFKKTSWWYASISKKQNIDILFVSHLVRESHAGDEKDFYFSDLPAKMDSYGYKSAIALINHTQANGSDMAKKWSNSKIPRYIFSGLTAFTTELGFFLRSNFESLKLKNIAASSNDSLLSRIAYKAAYELRQGSAINNLRIAQQVRMLVEQFKPRLIVTTFEGHGWERVVYSESKNANPLIRCVGYQHAAIFRLQHAIRRNLNKRFNPDSILTAGKVSFQQLVESNLEGVSIAVLGSDRGTVDNYVKERIKISKSCLVIPEGFISECILLFSFSLACAKESPDIEFIWRLHPLISFEEVKEAMEIETLPQNIKISTASIETDLNDSTWALYRGSTAIIQGINFGLIPLYHDDGSIIIDPIYQVNSSDLYMKSVSDFLRITRNKTNKLLDSELQIIRDYASDFFTPLDPQSLIEQISLVQNDESIRG